MRRLWELLQRVCRTELPKLWGWGGAEGEPMTPVASACGLEGCHPVSPVPLSPGGRTQGTDCTSRTDKGGWASAATKWPGARSLAQRERLGPRVSRKLS